MTPNSIKALIAIRGETLNNIAAAIRKRGVPCVREELSQTIHGHRENADIRQALADELGMKVEVLFDKEFEAIAALKVTA